MSPSQIRKWFTKLRSGILHNFFSLRVCKFVILNNFNPALLDGFPGGIFAYACKIGGGNVNLLRPFIYSMDDMRPPLRTLTFFLWIGQNCSMPNRRIIFGQALPSPVKATQYGMTLIFRFRNKKDHITRLRRLIDDIIKCSEKLTFA